MHSLYSQFIIRIIEERSLQTIDEFILMNVVKISLQFYNELQCIFTHATNLSALDLQNSKYDLYLIRQIKKIYVK